MLNYAVPIHKSKQNYRLEYLIYLHRYKNINLA